MSTAEASAREPLRVVFFGATEFGYRCCEEVLATGHDVVGIFSIPEQFPISYADRPVRNVTFRSFETLADAHGIPLRWVTSGRAEEYLPALEEWQPTFGLAIGWFYLVPAAVRAAVPRGVAGIHASLLPRYRGGAPLVWAMINGESETGVTLFYLEDGVDTGDMIAQRAVEILEDDTIGTVQARAVDASRAMLRETLPLIASGSAGRVPQDPTQATEYPQRKPADGLIDWSRTPAEVRNFIRAQTRPYPGAFTMVGGKKVTIWDADVEEVEQ